MKNILVTTDFSSLSDQASKYALRIAETAGAEIHFLHIQYTPVEWVSLDLDQEKNYPQIRKEIGHAKGELKKWEKKAQSKGLTVKTFLIFDAGHQRIIDHVAGYHHDFVVMASRGGSDSKVPMMGSTAQKIIRHASAPVLVIKENVPDFPMKNIIFASDFEEDLQGYFDKVVDFADLMEAAIHLVYINTPYHFENTGVSEEKMHHLLTHCPRGGTCSVNIYNARNEEEGILKFAHTRQADLIAITTKGKKGFLNFMASSITESLAANADIPVLSINIKTI